MKFFRVSCATGAAVLSLVSANPALADDHAIVLEPLSQWNVDFGDAKCRLARTFGGEDNIHLLFMETWGPSTGFGFTVAGKQIRRFNNKRPIMVKFYEEQEERETKPFVGDVEKVGKALIYTSLSLGEGDEEVDEAEQETAPVERSLKQLDVEQAANVKFASVRQGKQRVIFRTGPLRDAFKVMNQCSNQLMKAWGLDPEQQRGATRRPRWINQRAIAQKISKHYPRSALLRGEQGIMRMRVMIDAEGSVTECVINNATIQQSLESQACKQMQEARFEPALDANGEPMPSFHITSITYRVS